MKGLVRKTSWGAGRRVGLELPAGRGRVGSRFSTARRAFAVLDLTSSKTLSKYLGVSPSTCDCPINILFGLLSDGDVTVARVESPRRKPPPDVVRTSCTASPALAMSRYLITATGPTGAEDPRAACLGRRKVETSGGRVRVQAAIRAVE
jgi:hypothetical protein